MTWRYPAWLRIGLLALTAGTLAGAFAVAWPGWLALWGYGAPVLCGWAALEAWRRRLTLTGDRLVSRDMLGRETSVPVDAIRTIVLGSRPGLTIHDAEGPKIEVPRLVGSRDAILRALREAMEKRGVRVER